MTGYKSDKFRHDCDKQGCYHDGLPDWSDLIESFPRGIRPTDVDGMVEVNYYFLFLEQKRAGAAPTEGQRTALLRLSQMPKVTVMWLRPLKPDADDPLEVLIFEAGQGSGWKVRSRQWVKDWLRGWGRRADSGVAPHA